MANDSALISVIIQRMGVKDNQYKRIFLETIISGIIPFIILLGGLYYFFWVKIETTARFLVAVMIATSILYIGYDLLVTIFSYGTWAVFFKKLVGSIIIILPVFYALYWLEQYKKRKMILQNKDEYLEIDIITSVSKEDLAWEYGINAKKSASNFELDIAKIFAWLIDRKRYTVKTIVFIVVFTLLALSIIYDVTAESEDQYEASATTEEVVSVAEEAD